MINPYTQALPATLVEEVRKVSDLRLLLTQGRTGARSGPLNIELKGIYAAHRFAFLKLSILKLTPVSHVENAERLFDAIAREYSNRQKRPQEQVDVNLIFLSFETMWGEHAQGLPLPRVFKKYGLSES